MSLKITFSNGVTFDSEKPMNAWDLLRMYEDYRDFIPPEKWHEIESLIQQRFQEEESANLHAIRHHPYVKALERRVKELESQLF